MDKENKKRIELNVAIGLAVMLLIVISIIALKSGQKPVSLKEIGLEKEKKPVSGLQAALPGFKEMEEKDLSLKKDTPIEEEAARETEESLEEVTLLKDLPEDLSVPDEVTTEEDMEEETKTLKVQPSSEDIKEIKKRGFIIH